MLHVTAEVLADKYISQTFPKEDTHAIPVSSTVFLSSGLTERIFMPQLPAVQVASNVGMESDPYGVDSDKNDLCSPDLLQ